MSVKGNKRMKQGKKKAKPSANMTQEQMQKYFDDLNDAGKREFLKVNNGRFVEGFVQDGHHASRYAFPNGGNVVWQSRYKASSNYHHKARGA